jgi:hypothetical protein
VFFNTYPDVIAADFNADSRLDVALTAIDGIEGMVLLRFGRGDGTFDAPTALGAGRCNVRAAAADVNGDAATDLVTANYCGDSVSVLLNAGGGVFEQPATWTQAAGLCVHGGDFNGDGRLDLALCGNGAAVVLGNGDGTYQPPNVVAAGFETISMTLGDFNGDGNLDIAAGRANEDPVNEQVVLLPGNGDGTFQAPIYVPVAGRPGTFYVASGDFDGDLNADLITGDRTFGTITVLLGNGDGSFRTASILETGHFVTQLVVSDFNGDAKPDFLIAGGQLFFGNGDGTFGPLIDIRPDTYPAAEAAVAGDFNGDAKQDLALVFGSRVMGDGRSRPGLGVLLGNGDGTFEHADAQAYPLGRLPYSIAAADYDGDGVLDVATGNYGSNDVSVFSGNGDGTFEPALHFGATGGPVALVAGDVTGDGKPDLVAPVRTNFPAAPITQLINNTQ